MYSAVMVTSTHTVLLMEPVFHQGRVPGESKQGGVVISTRGVAKARMWARLGGNK